MCPAANCTIHAVETPLINRTFKLNSIKNTNMCLKIGLFQGVNIHMYNIIYVFIVTKDVEG